MSRDIMITKLRDLQTSGAVVRSALYDGILRRLTNVNNPDTSISDIDWGQLLSHYSALSEHMDRLWKQIDPSFSLYLAVPIKPTANHNDVPLFLSTMVGKEDTDSIQHKMFPQLSTPPNNEETFLLDDKTDLMQLQFDIISHNSALSAICASFENIDDAIKKRLNNNNINKSLQISKKRKIDELSSSDFIQKCFK